MMLLWFVGMFMVDKWCSVDVVSGGELVVG